MDQVLSDNGSITFDPEVPGDYLLLIGKGGSDNFGGGTIAAVQDNITFEELSAVTAATRRIVFLRGGEDLTITLAGATAPTVTCSCELIKPGFVY